MHLNDAFPSIRMLVRTETLLRGTEELKSHESLKLSLTSEPKMYLHINCCCVKHMVGRRFYSGMGKEEFCSYYSRTTNK